MNLVLDASATLAWIFADEDNDRAWPIIESLQHNDVMVVDIFGNDTMTIVDVSVGKNGKR